MIRKILKILGFRLYCVTFTIVDRYGKHLAMFTTICYAKSKCSAKRRAEKCFNSGNIMFFGDYDISIEEI